MQPVLDYLEKNRKRFVEDLCAYLRFPSVSAQSRHKPDLAACAGWLVERCRRIGLETSLCPTPGHPVVLASTPRPAGRGRRPHYVIYGHYDVQPAEPFELWTSPPFEPRIAGSSVFARGASDNKGQHLAHLNAVEAHLLTGTELPCDLTFVIEGEEEVGSANLPGFLKQHRQELACAGVVISDTCMLDKRHPCVDYGLRGIAAMEIRLDGPARDLHSGLFGGTVDNPASALCRMLASLHDARGRVAVPGFYKDVRPPTKFERAEAARLPFRETAYRKMLGVPKLHGERGFTPIEQRTVRPTLEINGLTSGYQGEGSKTINPAWASAKLTFRLVPDQRPEVILELVRKHLVKLCPPTVRLRVEKGHGAVPYFVDPTGPLVRAGRKALEAAFGCPSYVKREGGSIPIVTQFKRILGADSLLAGLALPDDNAHSPDEKFDLDLFEGGMRMSALLWRELAESQ